MYSVQMYGFAIYQKFKADFLYNNCAITCIDIMFLIVDYHIPSSSIAENLMVGYLHCQI